MREDEWTFTPSHLQVLDTNYKPIINGTEHAIWRRIMLLPFAVTIPEAEQDKHLTTKLRAERPDILHWMIRGCLEWQRIGLNPPAVVLEASKEYRDTCVPSSTYRAAPDPIRNRRSLSSSCWS
jgi:putative DNA primase/helicase